ncbi:MAG: hypothetical protein LBG96_15005, partial [Tannerella sp.]|nr:hypothetical protein [Tannerella sp.]
SYRLSFNNYFRYCKGKQSFSILNPPFSIKAREISFIKGNPAGTTLRDFPLQAIKQCLLVLLPDP